MSIKINPNSGAHNFLMREKIRNPNKQIICEHLTLILSKIKGMTVEKATAIAMRGLPHFWEGGKWNGCTLPAMKDFKAWEIHQWFGISKRQLFEIFKYMGVEK